MAGMYVCMVVARQVTSCFPMPHSGEEDQSGEGTAIWALVIVSSAPVPSKSSSLSMAVCMEFAMRWCTSAHPLCICMYSRGRARETMDVRACRACACARLHTNALAFNTHAHSHSHTHTHTHGLRNMVWCAAA